MNVRTGMLTFLYLYRYRVHSEASLEPGTFPTKEEGGAKGFEGRVVWNDVDRVRAKSTSPVQPVTVDTKDKSNATCT